MDEVQMDGSGKSNWTYIEIDSESLLFWTIQLDERPNKHPYTLIWTSKYLCGL